MYSNPGFIAGVGVTTFCILFGLFHLVAARRRARTIRVLEQRGRAIAVEVTSIRFKALDRLGNSYGQVSFIYEYEGKVYKRKQAIDELSAQEFLRRSVHPSVLVLPEKPRCARLAYTRSKNDERGPLFFDDETTNTTIPKNIVCDDPKIRMDTLVGIIFILYPFMVLALVVVWFLMLQKY